MDSTISQWITWAATTIAAVIALMAGVYARFQTKESAKDSAAVVEKRLDRLENKVDILLDRSK